MTVGTSNPPCVRQIQAGEHIRPRWYRRRKHAAQPITISCPEMLISIHEQMETGCVGSAHPDFTPARTSASSLNKSFTTPNAAPTTAPSLFTSNVSEGGG
eukprot:1249796-Pyramimonas_sp.AAC.2